MLRGLPVRGRSRLGPATRRGLPGRSGALRHLRGSVRTGVRLRGRGGSVADGAGVRPRHRARQASPDLPERRGLRWPASEDAGIGPQGAGRVGPQAVQHTGRSGDRPLRGIDRIPRGQGVAALRAVRRRALCGGHAGRSRRRADDAAGPRCPQDQAIPAGRRYSASGLAPAPEPVEPGAPDQCGCAAVRQGTATVPDLVRDQVRPLPRHAGRETDPFLPDLPGHGLRAGGSGGGLRPEQARAIGGYAGREHSGSHRLRDSEGGGDRGHRQRRGPPRLHERGQCPGHAVRGPAGYHERRRAATASDGGEAACSARVGTGQPPPGGVHVPARIHRAHGNRNGGHDSPLYRGRIAGAGVRRWRGFRDDDSAARLRDAVGQGASGEAGWRTGCTCKHGERAQCSP